MRKKCHSIGKLLSRGGRGGVKVGGGKGEYACDHCFVYQIGIASC